MENWLNKTIESVVNLLRSYEDRHLQLMAFSLIPLQEFKEATASAVHNYRGDDKASLSEIIFLKRLVVWFKRTFFKWLDIPNCDRCLLKMTLLGVHPDSEPFFELMECERCGQIKLFPRYRDASILLETRTGRCFEWTQIFCLMCRALKWRTRFVVDITDHCWIEVFSKHQKRWLHVDPSEGVIDTPWLYEVKWQKKLKLILGIGIDDIQDVTWRYSCDHQLVLKRRTLEMDRTLLQSILRWRKNLNGLLCEEEKKRSLVLVVTELLELMVEKHPVDAHKWTKYLNECENGEDSCYHVWAPTENELKHGAMTIMYSSKEDLYIKDEKEYVGWSKWAYSCKSMKRTIENSTRATSLTKIAGASSGSITWTLTTAGTNYFFKSVALKVNGECCDGGTVEWTLSNGKRLINYPNPGSYTIADLQGSMEITVSAHLQGECDGTKALKASVFKQGNTENSFFDFISTTFTPRKEAIP